MKRFSLLGIALVVTLLIAACSPGNAPTPGAASTPVAVATQPPAASATNVVEASPTAPAQSQPGEAKTDSQGSVTVVLTPENLNDPGETLVFDVAMDTHSVNLGMDLTKLATLTTDGNSSVPASGWDSPEAGGHHVSGKLTFPATDNGKSILEGASQLTITIANVDAPSRVFTWQLPK